MRRSRIRLLSVLVAFLLAAVAYGRGSTPKELVVNLKFAPQEGVTSNAAQLPPSVLEKSIEIRVEDARKSSDPIVIGTGTGGDDRSFPIKAGSEITGYLKDTLTDLAKQWGAKVDGHPDRILVVQVTRFFIDESNKALGSVYSTEVNLAWTLKDARGNKLAEGTGAGSTHRYGRAHSQDNINEVLSDALKEAFANVMNDGNLHTAWGKK
ncbi:MAG TPA: YajG family lipoprotein [Thermoanaerobaculia bacterium]|nr:YajG family lipoprotein [Thermoanaerobaculia bacterium]